MQRVIKVGKKARGLLCLHPALLDADSLISMADYQVVMPASIAASGVDIQERRVPSIGVISSLGNLFVYREWMEDHYG